MSRVRSVGGGLAFDASAAIAAVYLTSEVADQTADPDIFVGDVVGCLYDDIVYRRAFFQAHIAGTRKSSHGGAAPAAVL